MVCMKFSTEILSLNPWNRFVSFFVINAGVNLEMVKIRSPKVLAFLPVDLLHEMLIMLCVRVGYEGAGSNVAFRKHLNFCHMFNWRPLQCIIT